MQKQLLLIAVIGLAIIVGVTFAGYRLGKIAEKKGTKIPASSSPSTSPTPISSPTPTPPLATPNETSSPKNLPTAPPQSQSLKNRSQSKVLPSNKPTVAPSSTHDSNAWSLSRDYEDTSIEFVDLPNTVKSGEPFVVTWRVAGKNSVVVESTTLNVSYSVSSESDYGLSNSSSNSSQSFGQFSTPKEFSVRLQYSGYPGDIKLNAKALINGKTVNTEKEIQLES